MSDLAIRAEGLSKRYRLGETEPRYRTIRETLMAAPARMLHRRGRREEERTLWALRDVSFEIPQGEAVGIIGRNGAGKSTLLKILSRITEPTGGHATVHGRVGSLLEVGTGFHQELTGRENIYLNGAILGMSRADIKARFDEIVAFAEVERFLDTPVKRYSSGMYMRLAFSVAAHLEPDILIVDEVLAVGDASFQRKCLNKMEDVGQHGRTVIFVSHNMAAITRLCRRAILLSDGTVLEDGSAARVVSAYLRSGAGSAAEREWHDPQIAPADEIVRLRAIRVRNDLGVVSESLDIRRPISIEVEYEVLTPGHVLAPVLNLTDENGSCVFVSIDLNPEWRDRPRPRGRFLSTATIPGNFLAEGGIQVRTHVITPDPFVMHFDVHDAVAFHVTDSLDGDSARGRYGGWMPGVVRPLLPWEDLVLSEQPEADQELSSFRA